MDKQNSYNTHDMDLCLINRRMKMTFLCDEKMVITIPIGMKDMPGGHCMPEKFHCVYRDFYKVFVVNGKPKPLGVSLIILSQSDLCPT